MRKIVNADQIITNKNNKISNRFPINMTVSWLGKVWGHQGCSYKFVWKKRHKFDITCHRANKIFLSSIKQFYYLPVLQVQLTLTILELRRIKYTVFVYFSLFIYLITQFEKSITGLNKLNNIIFYNTYLLFLAKTLLFVQTYCCLHVTDLCKTL